MIHLVAALALAAVVTPAAGVHTGWWPDDSWPDAGLTVTDVNFTGQPVIFDSELDTAGLSFDFDFEGDGVYDLTAGNLRDPRVSHTYTEPGRVTAAIRTTDLDDGSVTVDHLSFIVTDAAIGNLPALPVPGVTPKVKASVDRPSVTPGGTVTVTVPDIGDGESFSVRLVPATDDPWAANAVDEFGPFIGSTTGNLELAEDDEVGTYKLLVTTSDRRATTINLTIDDLAAESAEEAASDRDAAQRQQAISRMWVAVIAGLLAAVSIDLTRSSRGRSREPQA